MIVFLCKITSYFQVLLCWTLKFRLNIVITYILSFFFVFNQEIQNRNSLKLSMVMHSKNDKYLCCTQIRFYIFCLTAPNNTAKRQQQQQRRQKQQCCVHENCIINACLFFYSPYIHAFFFIFRSWIFLLFYFFFLCLEHTGLQLRIPVNNKFKKKFQNTSQIFQNFHSASSPLSFLPLFLFLTY